MSDTWKELESEIAKLLFKYGFTVDQCLKLSQEIVKMLKREQMSDVVDEEKEMRKLKIYAFEGEYQVFEAPRIRIKMFCSVCKKWIVPDRLSLGKAHIYGVHCGVNQDLGCVWFNEK